ncbi:MAG TPA: sulfotransferase [Kineosporiaceae bacterium]
MIDLSFLLVGTPRSGTTLLQRLCCELPGVAMPPETHFLQLFAPDLLTRVRFPLGPDEVVHELARFGTLPTSTGLDPDPDRVLALLGGRCDHLLDLFAAVVVALCPGAGSAVRYGEKTPEHLLWWRAVTTARPRTRIVGVVRDPRSVAASHRAVPWGTQDAAELAEEWALDQAHLRLAARALGPGRCLVLRYEDVVTDPGAARARLAAFLEAAPPVDGPGPAGPGAPVGGRPGHIVHDWEWWKARALQPVTATRLHLWREALPAGDVATVERVAGRQMAAFGYLPAEPARAAGGEVLRCAKARPTDGATAAVRGRLAARLARVRGCEEVMLLSPSTASPLP